MLTQEEKQRIVQWFLTRGLSADFELLFLTFNKKAIRVIFHFSVQQYTIYSDMLCFWRRQVNENLPKSSGRPSLCSTRGKSGRQTDKLSGRHDRHALGPRGLHDSWPTWQAWHTFIADMAYMTYMPDMTYIADIFFTLLWVCMQWCV